MNFIPSYGSNKSCWSNMSLPFLIIAPRKVAAEMRAAGLFTGQCRFDHQLGHGEHVLQLPARPVIEFACEHVTAPEGHVALRLKQPRPLANDAHVADHQGAQ